MMYIEHEGALFRGAGRGNPQEVWSRKEKRFVPYTGRVPKPTEWGYDISEADAKEMIAKYEFEDALANIERLCGTIPNDVKALLIARHSEWCAQRAATEEENKNINNPA